MLKRKITALFLAAVLIAGLSGCGLVPAAAGPKAEARPFYALAENADKLYAAIIQQDWTAAQEIYIPLSEDWQKAKVSLAEKDTQAGDKSIVSLFNALNAADSLAACQSLNKFMNTAAEIGEKKKIMPLSVIIAVGIAQREVEFYTLQKDWEKAAAKSKGLKNVWNRGKPAIEQFGILKEVTEAHLLIERIEDAIETQDQDAAEKNFAKLNETWAKIRQFHSNQ